MSNSICHCRPTEFSPMPAPLFRLVCHCTTCQDFLGQPLNDECTFLRQDFPSLNLDAVEFKSYQTALSPITRGKCKTCGQVAYCQAKIGPLHLIMVPSTRLESTSLPEAQAHIYYHRSQRKANDQIPKISGHLPSQRAILSLVLKSLMQRLRK